MRSSETAFNIKVFNIAKNPKHDGYQRGLASKRKLYPSYVDNIWGTDLADMQLWSKFSKTICFLLCFIDIFSKYAWVIPMKDKKGTTILMLFKIS